jgi:Mor family transcriptional regulator
MALPATIQTIVRLVGHAKAMSMVQDLGGQSYRFPVSRKSDVWEHLVEIIGARSAEVLCQEFGGSEVYIALCHHAIKADRNRSMIARYEALLAEGHSSRGAVTVLVREFRMSNRQIEKIVNGPSPAGEVMEMVTQGSLF